MLPGANCGACGFSGCDGYAAALAHGEAKVGLCSPGGAECAEKISAYLGVDNASVEAKTALVHCLGSYDNTTDKVVYEGIQTCAAAVMVAGGIASCQYGCMGLGDCMRACQYGAISICNGVAKIDPHKCKGCSMCVAACPKHLISFVPLKSQAVLRCSNCDKGAMTNKVDVYKRQMPKRFPGCQMGIRLQLHSRSAFPPHPGRAFLLCNQIPP